MVALRWFSWAVSSCKCGIVCNIDKGLQETLLHPVCLDENQKCGRRVLSDFEGVVDRTATNSLFSSLGALSSDVERARWIFREQGGAHRFLSMFSQI